ELPRRPKDQPVLGILPALGAEGAADVARDDPDALLGDAEDGTGQHLADPMRVLDVRMEGVAILAGVVDAEGAARLHVLGVHPCDDVAAGYDMRGSRERRVDG